MAQAPKFLAYGFVQWICSMALSLLIVFALVALILGITSWSYLLRHPVAAYEQDLGYGLVMVGMLVVCAIIALPAVGLLAWRFKKIIAHKVYEVTNP